MSLWEEYDMLNKLTTILSEVQSYEPEHHLGRPFTTSYQLALLFKQKYGDAYKKLVGPENGLEGTGGEGHGKHVSLAQYLARELSGHVRDNPDSVIEGAFLSQTFVDELVYDDGSERVASSLGKRHDLSMFRIFEHK